MKGSLIKIQAAENTTIRTKVHMGQKYNKLQFNYLYFEMITEIALDCMPPCLTYRKPSYFNPSVRVRTSCNETALPGIRNAQHFILDILDSSHNRSDPHLPGQCLRNFRFLAPKSFAQKSLVSSHKHGCCRSSCRVNGTDLQVNIQTKPPASSC